MVLPVAQNPPQLTTLQQAIQAVSPASEAQRIAAIGTAFGGLCTTFFAAEGRWIDGLMVRPFYELLQQQGHVETLILFLRSTGGYTEVPWKIVSLLREYCNELVVLVPHVALSGATHIALAGDRLVMSLLSTLGSVDPTRQHPLLPAGPGGPTPTSVQDLKHTVEFIKTQLGHGQSREVAQIITELFRHVHPLALGALDQSAELSKLITRKVLRTRRKQLSSRHVERIVERLAGQYFSHAFQISRRDVREDLGLTVEEPTPVQLQAMMDLLDAYERVAGMSASFARQGGMSQVSPGVIFENGTGRRVCYYVTDGQQTQQVWQP